MKLSGTNQLFIPRVPYVFLTFDNIVLDNTGTYTISTSQYSSQTPLSGADYTRLFCSLSSGFIGDSAGRIVGTYNTGENFAVSGWIDLVQQKRYLIYRGVTIPAVETGIVGQRVGLLNISCPSNSLFRADIIVKSSPYTTYMTFNSLPFRGTGIGYIGSDVGQYIQGGELQFYKSYEQQLIGGPLIAFISSSGLADVRYTDNDSAYTNNDIIFDYFYNTTNQQNSQQFTISRTGLHYFYYTGFTNTTESPNFSGLFDGYWSGSGFYFNDAPISTWVTYNVTLSDAYMNQSPMTIDYSIILTTGAVHDAQYITGFQLTNKGEYSNPPILMTTGYWSSSGIQQTLNSMLFSSGCTGNLKVSYTGANNMGAKASGLLQTLPVTFSGTYGQGIRIYRTVVGYTATSTGTGYSMAPRAYVNTGEYGVKCYDVPRVSGYNEAWFKPFDTSGTLDRVEAAYFTGVPLYVSGLCSGGATGWWVTGIDVTNIGMGYNTLRPPLLKFVRTGTDVLTINASGNLLLKVTGKPLSTSWSAMGGVAGQPLISGMTGTFNTNGMNNLMFEITCSGSDITTPITGAVHLYPREIPTLDVVANFYYSKYYDPDPNLLKKKLLNPVIYPINSDLSFLVSQDELDTIYSTAGYLTNTWTFEEGDFDF